MGRCSVGADIMMLVNGLCSQLGPRISEELPNRNAGSLEALPPGPGRLSPAVHHLLASTALQCLSLVVSPLHAMGLLRPAGSLVVNCVPLARGLDSLDSLEGHNLAHCFWRHVHLWAQ